ncbi:hypothetical protein [Micromonospora aurantiaca (nom. illeg.)]|uniref:hypothetical protein n=1 Tax=Micromonospora aurantiaca (nom. illeg.) TaxID=47850 RepID=UPI0008288017|nr:hypothetical protein [Micromonospora aurantiaca]SCL40052.1 hypothetical protein GA0070615_4257 [Micromonospora aurantiaca]
MNNEKALPAATRQGHSRPVKVPQTVARAYVGRPCCGRTMWAVTVLNCPHCGGMHHHRAGSETRLMTRQVVKRCPSKGAPYRLRPVSRAPRVVTL